MTNSELAAVGDVTVEPVQPSGRSTNNVRSWTLSALALFQRIDGWAQGYFNALAQARARKPEACRCEWQRYDSFC